MKHRPQGSLGDSSCQDWREEKKRRVHKHTDRHAEQRQIPGKLSQKTGKYLPPHRPKEPFHVNINLPQTTGGTWRQTRDLGFSGTLTH